MALDSHNFRIGTVLDIYDEQGGDRIKVSLEPVDNFKSSKEEIDYAMPCLPKFLHVKPKVNEKVLIITEDPNNPDTQRYYIGPLISQENKLQGDTNQLESLSMYRGAEVTPGVNPRLKRESKGAFPKDEDISIEGRKNAGVQITEDDVRIKAGVKLVNNSEVSFNPNNPAYIKVKYHTDDSKKTSEYDSTVSIVADKINLLSNTSPDYSLTDREDLITDADMDRIIKKAHQIPYGDVLIEFIELFKEAFNKHTHPFSMLPPCQSGEMVNLNNYNLKKILSDTVRIN